MIKIGQIVFKIMEIINSKFKIISNDLIAFTKASGDWNPIHYDKIISRRYFTERPIIHGILLLLKVLNEYISYKKVNIISIKCNFKLPLYPDNEYKLCFEKLTNNSDNLYLFDNKNLLFNCNLKFNYSFKKYSYKVDFKIPCKSNPLNKDFKDLENYKGRLELQIDKNFFINKFQYLIDHISIQSLASIISTSRLVGMICPGLNSIYSSLDIYLNEDYSDEYLYWQVDSASRRILPVSIAFRSPGLRGSLKAFYREEPIEQLSIKDLSKKINKKNLSSQNILIIGGSRGIGEITAKLLSFRNANLTLTYNNGLNDVDRIVNEIIEYGCRASFSYLNVLDFDTIDKFFNNNKYFDQIYYYASPRIKDTKNTLFDYDLYENYNKYYIKPLIKLSEILSKNKNKKCKIFYPSTIFLDEDKNNSFTEYQASKLLGEFISRNIEDQYENISVLISRLPRLLTDQTSKTNKLLIANSTLVIDRILDQMYS